MRSEVTRIALCSSLILLTVLFAYINYKNVTSYVTPNEEFGQISSAESVEESSVATATKSNLYFVGDVMLGRDVEQTLRTKDFSYPYKNLIFNADTDYVFANFESAIPAVHQKTPNNTFRFSVNARFLPDFKKAGFTHLSLANNHTFDYGLPGYNQTISTLWNFGFIPFGHPTIFSTSSVTFLEVGDLTISLIALHTLFSAPSTETISGVLTYATTNSDLQIVTVHWGEEYAPIHSNEQEAMAKVLAKAGADIIVGHHPHVVQDIQMVGDTLVFYSLGNFIFDQYFSVPVQQGLMLKLDSSLNISLLPYSSEEVRVQPAPMESQKAALFYQNLSRVSDTALASYIIDGFIPYRNMLASSTEVVIMTE